MITPDLQMLNWDLGEFKGLLEDTANKGYNRHQIWSWFQIPSPSIPLSCLPGNSSEEQSFIMWPRCYPEEVLLVPSSRGRKWQWHPEDGGGIGACCQAGESSQPPPTRRRGTCWCCGLSRSPSFHVICRDLNKILLPLKSIKIERTIIHQEFYLITFTLEADTYVWLTQSSLGKSTLAKAILQLSRFSSYIYVW